MKAIPALSNIVSFALNDPKTFFRFLKTLITQKYPEPTLVQKISQSELASAMSQGRSLIRVGDGEVMLLTGRSLHFQKYRPEIKSLLMKMINDYQKDSSYVLAVPYFALEESFETLNERGRARIWRLFRILFANFRKGVPYADAVAFYHHGYFEEIIQNVPKINRLIIVTSKQNQTLELDNYLQSKNANYLFVTTPIKNAFDDYPTIKDQVLAMTQNEPTTVLVACGPAGKVLAYELSQNKIQCVDIGHGIEILGKVADYSDRL